MDVDHVVGQGELSALNQLNPLLLGLHQLVKRILAVDITSNAELDLRVLDT